MPTLPKHKTKNWIVKRDTRKGRSTGMNNHKGVVSFYNTKRWRSVRNYFFQRNPLCKTCKDNGLIQRGHVVDHRVPIRQGGHEYLESNLQTLCEKCHNKKSQKESQTIVYNKQNMKR